MTEFGGKSPRLQQLLTEEIELTDIWGPSPGSPLTAPSCAAGGRLKVAHLCSQDYGGAGKAALRLHRGLRGLGVDSTVVVAEKLTGDAGVVEVGRRVAPGEAGARSAMAGRRAAWEELLRDYPDRPPGLEIFTDTVSEMRLEDCREIAEADIIHWHWVAGMLDYARAPQVFKGKRLIWTLHDMNPFTGGCHYAGDCRKYERQCAACPQLGSQQTRDLAARIWESKKEVYAQLEMQLVTPSRWLAARVRESALLGGFPVEVIPNSAPLEVFKTYARQEIREALGVAADARVVLFGADGLNNRRKGFAYLLEALRRYTQTHPEVVLATFGHSPPRDTLLGCKVLDFQYITDEQQLALLYNLADVFVLPSLEDNLPNTAVEALACGVPVAGFAAGGIPEIVAHQQTGFLAPPGDVEGLTEAIHWCLTQADGGQLRRRGRQQAEQEYAPQRQAERYRSLYQRRAGQPVAPATSGGAPDELPEPRGEREAPDTILIAANLVPFQDPGQRQRQEECIKSLARLTGRGVAPLNICYADELLEPEGWRTLSRLQRSADRELGVNGKRKPIVLDLFDLAADYAREHGWEWFVVTNSDIIFTAAFIEELRRLMRAGFETAAVSRTEAARGNGDHGLVPGKVEMGGNDVFCCQTAWWLANRQRFQPYILGERVWDHAFVAVMASHSRFHAFFQEGLCFHISHPVAWKTAGPYSDYNMNLFNGVDRPYQERYYPFIHEVLNAPPGALTFEATQSLVDRHFRSRRAQLPEPDEKRRAARKAAAAGDVPGGPPAPEGLRLLLVVHGFPPQSLAGTELYTYNLARELARRGHEVRVLYPRVDRERPEGEITEDRYEGLPVTRMNIHPAQDFLGLFQNDARGGRFADYLATLKVDLVHFQHLIGFSASALHACRKLGIPALMTVHDGWLVCDQWHFMRVDGSLCPGPETVDGCVACLRARNSTMDLEEQIPQLFYLMAWRRQYLQKSLACLEGLIFPSECMRACLERYGCRHPRMTVTPLGLQPQESRPRATDPEVIRFTFLGHITHRKGADLAVRAFKLVASPRARLDLYGGVTDKDYGQRVMAEIATDRRITYHGPYTPADLPGILSRTDVAVVPSRWESYSLVTRECLQAGVPVIGADVWAIPEVIADGVNGRLFRGDDHVDLAAKMEALAADPARVAELQRGIEPVRTCQEEAAEIEGHYYAALGRRRPTATPLPAAGAGGEAEGLQTDAGAGSEAARHLEIAREQRRRQHYDDAIASLEKAKDLLSGEVVDLEVWRLMKSAKGFKEHKAFAKAIEDLETAKVKLGLR